MAGVGASPALAQRHIKGLNSLSASYGATEKGMFTEVSFARLLSNRNALRLAVTRENGTMGASGDYSAYGVRAAFSPQLFRLGEEVYVHLLVGGTGQYERTGQKGSATNIPEDAKRPQRFTYGPVAGAEVDFFLANRFSIVGTATKTYLFNNPLIDKWAGFYSGGLRYYFR